MESKKAQNLSITTIILIILGVIVLVVLIIGFTKGWGSVKGFFTAGGGSETQQVSTLCNIACTTEDIESWCITDRGNGETCNSLAEQGKFVSCIALRTKCPTKKCLEEVVTPATATTAEVKAKICKASVGDKCPVGSEISGTWSDAPNGVCCKVACIK